MMSDKLGLVISQTGIRDGEIIMGRPGAKQSQGVIFKIKGLYPANSSKISELDPVQIRDTFSNIPFFSSLSLEERYDWLQKHQQAGDNYLEDFPKLQLKFLQISGNNFFSQKLSQDTINSLLSGNSTDPEGYWNIRDVYNLFPRKPGSRARRTTLVFRPNNWVLQPSITSTSWDGIFLDLDTFQYYQGSIKSDNKTNVEILEVQGNPIVALKAKKGKPWTKEQLYALQPQFQKSDIAEIECIIGWFPPSMHKSLIQKLIRTRCLKVEYGGKNYEASLVLMVSLTLLLTHPGVFVPNLQKFVTGFESGVKRLAVTICEDGYCEYPEVIASLFGAALMKQRDKTWFLDVNARFSSSEFLDVNARTQERSNSEKIVKVWYDIALKVQSDKRRYKYDWNTFIQINNPNITNLLHLSYYLLNEIRSFVSDINMVGSIANNGGCVDTSLDQTWEVMPIIHCLDHHSYTQIAYHIPPNGTLIKMLNEKSYAQIFSSIWNLAVGINPRSKPYDPKMELKPEVREIRRAQIEVWISKMYAPVDRPILENKIDFSYRLDPSWLAGLIGPIEILLSYKSALVVLRPDLIEFRAIKRPQRGNDIPLTEVEEVSAIAQAKTILKNGVIIKNVPETLNFMKGCKVFLVDDEGKEIYKIQINGKTATCWTDLTRIDLSFGVHSSIEPTIYNSCISTGNGVDERCKEKLEEYLSSIDRQVLQRSLVFLDNYRDWIDMYKLSRNGSGTYYSVKFEDIAIHSFISALCVLFPAAITRVKGRDGFKIKSGPLFWWIKDRIKEKLKNISNVNGIWFPLLEETRIRWTHQIIALDQMLYRQNQGKRGHLIWIEVGMGKTLIVVDYIDQLIRQNKMVPYCVYTLPSSAIDNVRAELERRGLIVNLLDARKITNSNVELIKGKINMIRHDHLRMDTICDKLRKVSNQTLFIVDEFHKTLAKTQRTSMALELSRTSWDFVALSGTLIKDNNVDELIQWLEQGVEFQVTQDNYWVAVASLISSRQSTGVEVDRQVVEVEMKESDYNTYRTLVPAKLGGVSSTIKFKEAVNFCYKVIDHVMIEKIIGLLDVGIFVVAKDKAHQERLKQKLLEKGVTDEKISLFGNDHQLTLEPDYNGPIRVVITTQHHNAGYTLTFFKNMISAVYFSNQATRDQLEGRINRIGQIGTIHVRIYHCGILSYINTKYEKCRSLAKALKGFAGEFEVSEELKI